MHFSMDDIGIENIEKVRLMQNESMKGEFIYEVAKGYGFDGIHFTPSFYKGLGLDLHNIPDYFEDFKLTLHLGGLYKMHDISIHLRWKPR